MKKRWWYRWKTQGFLLTPEGEHPYQPDYFILKNSAKQFQNRLHRDHGPGMLRTECRKNI